jgi:hypothetical protein
MFKTIFLDGMVTVAVNRGIDKETAIPLMKKYLVKIDTNDELIQSMGSAYFCLTRSYVRGIYRQRSFLKII